MSSETRTRKISKKEKELQFIKDPALKRAAFKVGIERVSKPVYNVSREILRQRLKDILDTAISFVTNSGRKTLKTSDVLAAMKVLHYKVAYTSGQVTNAVGFENKKMKDFNFEFQQAPIKRLIKSYGGADLRVQRNAVNLIQVIIENYIDDLYRDAKVISKHCNRRGIKDLDVNLACSIRCDKYNR